jgi:hypothetical protein
MAFSFIQFRRVWSVISRLGTGKFTETLLQWRHSFEPFFVNFNKGCLQGKESDTFEKAASAILAVQLDGQVGGAAKQVRDLRLNSNRKYGR